MTKLIVHLVLLLNFAYLALLSLQTMFCNDIKKFNKHKLFGIPLRRRLYRLWLALRFEKFRGFVYLLVSSWIYTFDYLNKLYEGKVQEENTYFLIRSEERRVGKECRFRRLRNH